MKNIFSLFVFIGIVCTLNLPVIAQESQGIQPGMHAPLTPDEQFILSNIPELKLPDKYKGPDAPLLPYWIDNSTQPYFRPITSQSGFECGQSAGIAFNFTYEIDRLRNVPANTTTNQYPTHFTWDFLNNGDNYTGASAFDSWEIVRACGNMNVFDYGGTLNYGGYLRWISGYDKYYNGMSNRLNYMRGIRVDNPAGLQTLKYWLVEHLEGSTIGGIATFYGQYFSPTKTLPAGTPEGGKYVQTSWGASPSHTWTVCGFNDSIRYDYNGDGQYTNTIDINGDGIVDMHDWEIGGLKFANGYAGTGWSNAGFCYMMYKTLADAIGYGGIWNHTVYVIDVKQTCSPKLTMKITLKHNSRNKIKVTAGMNTDLSSSSPSVLFEPPIFKYQGGDHYMQGGNTEADKTIEFGLDLTPLLGELASGTPAKWFLQVQENDPGNAYTGEVVGWSLIDYTSGIPVETVYPTTNTPILNNGITRLSVNYTVSFSKPEITTASMPPANLYQPYSCQLSAASGTPPYLWDARLTYPEIVTSSGFPNITAQQLTLTNNNTGYAIKTLPFDFPFYKRTVNKLYIYADGYILFDDQPFTWPYLIDKMLLFKQTSILSPFMCDLCVYPSQGQGIWYEGNAGSATIRWKISVYNMSGSTSLNFAVKLYPDGKIEFYYGTMTYPVSTAWTGGISGGDNKNYQFSSLNNSSSITTNTLDQFNACGFPVEMTISEEGLFSGTPVHPYQNRAINFVVTDNNNISNTKVLLFNTNGLLVSYTVSSGGDSIIEYGETASLKVTITNIGNQVVHNTNMWITRTDPYITLLDSTEFVGNINPGQSIPINNAFSFGVNSNVPNNHGFTVQLHISSQEQNFVKQMDLFAFAPLIRVGDIALQDGDNGRLDPGETTDMLVSFENRGGAKASSINVLLTTADTNMILNVNSGVINALKPDSVRTITFNVTGGSQAPFEHLYLMNAQLTAASNYSAYDSIYLLSGEIIEDFETGTLNKFNWFTGGYAPWSVDATEHYEGAYCSRSGWIFDNQESTLNITVNVLANGSVSFWKKVSCEHDPSGSKNYDYLAFFIDNTEMGRWDGLLAWSKETFSVRKGYHTFKWVYHKDYSVSSYSDCSWIDFITFPPFEGALPVITASPLSFEKNLETGQSATDTLIISNSGGAILNFSVIVFDTSANNKDEYQTDNVGSSYIECYTEGFVPGEDFSWTFVLHNQSSDNEYIRHVKMDFPPGIMVNTATNFSGGSLGELIFQGTPGNGASLNWHGESAGGRGVVKPGETASTMITGSVPETFMEDGFVVNSIRGDSIGAIPHNTSGHVKLNNFGLVNTWLALSENFGSLVKNETDSVILHFNTDTLVAGNYFCYILARDLYNNKFVIPVTVNITDPISYINPDRHPGTGLTRNYPNPFSHFTRIEYSTDSKDRVVIEITDMSGKPVSTLVDKMQPAGDYSITWNGKTHDGAPVAPGIYTCRMKTSFYSGTLKMVLMR